jgi:membrane protein DedA with SNARE-associated domain
MEASALAHHLIEFLQGFDGLTAYAVILGLLLVCGLGIPLPEDITLIGAGILAALGSISLPGALGAGLVGVLMGDAILFNLGRRFGRSVFELPGFRRVFTPARVALAEQKVLNNSQFICFTARFLPGLRAPIYLTAGILGVRPSIFYTLDGMAALISVPLWVVGGWWVALNLDIDTALAYAKRAQGVIIVVFLVVFSLYVLYRRGRKRALKQAALINSPSDSQS